MIRNNKSIFNIKTIAILLALLMIAGSPASSFAVEPIDEYAEEPKTEVNLASSMEELASEVDAPDSSVDATSDYAYKSLILEGTYDEEIQAYGADEAYYFDDYYLLKYDTEEDAREAHDALSEEYGDESIIPNIPLTISDTKQTYGWGTDYMDMNYEQIRASMGTDVTVAVIDTGINSAHEVFSGRDIVNAYDLVNDIEGNAADDNGHGTAVAGIIAESTPENVKIMPIKALDKDGNCDTITLLAAMEYAEEMGADIVNMSLGGYVSTTREMDLCNRLFGIYSPLQICAAGNENMNMDKSGVHEIPGELDCTVCVGSIDINDKRSSFSNYGTALDFTAPGEMIDIAYYKGGHRTSSGTSFSSPYIAAAAALVKANNASFDNAQITARLRDISKDYGVSGPDCYYGNGCPKFINEDNPGEPIDFDDITVLIHDIKTNFTYSGKAFEQHPFVIAHGMHLDENKDYTISYKNNVNAGTAYMTITGKGLFSGTKTVSFKIKKAANTIKAVGKTASVRNSNLKKKAQTIALSKVIGVSNAKGKLTYTKVSGSSRLSINKTTGKVTVKKGTKKGTYKMKVRVSAAGNVNYNAANRTVTFSVKVK